MNEKKAVLKLLDLTGEDHPFGNSLGKQTYQKLSDYIEQHPQIKVLGISLEGIEATDASFPRESVISIAKNYRQTLGVYLEHVKNRDVLDNWNYAADAKHQPLVVWEDSKYELLGPEITSAARELVEFVLSHKAVLASQVSKEFGISVQNASTRLKKLVEQGYFLRNEVPADSGGIEYRYEAIK